mmetsp:Transcript_2904/g.5309  ORF Transcript_2904/g.5309 Transcript_2904/m.5309 type:complete len:277 (+) Transcript_2904:133-963(+)
MPTTALQWLPVASLARTRLSIFICIRHTHTHTHAALFKPDGVLSQFVYNNKTTPLGRHQKLLGALPSTAALPSSSSSSSCDGNPCMPIGRLDQDSEGLLLLSTDGRLSYYLSKAKQVEKEYYVQVEGAIATDTLHRLAAGHVGISLGRGKVHMTQPCRVERLPDVEPLLPPRSRPVHSLIRKKLDGSIVLTPTSWLSITLVEGKNRQVRKMTAAVGHPTLRLVRVRVGDVSLGDLLPGELRVWEPDRTLLDKAHAFCDERNRERSALIFGEMGGKV